MPQLDVVTTSQTYPVQVISMSVEHELNRIGRWSARIPLYATNIEQLQEQRKVKLYDRVGDTFSEVGVGKIQRISPSVTSGQDTMTVEGQTFALARLDETLMNSVIIGEYALKDEPGDYAEYHEPNVPTSDDITADITTGGGGYLLRLSSDGGGGTYDISYVYFGSNTPFDALYFDILASDLNTQSGSQILVQYFNGDGWQTLTVTDGTEAVFDLNDTTFRQDGLVSWTTPTDWVKGRHTELNYYWVRVTVSSFSSEFTINDVQIRTISEDSGDIATIETSYFPGDVTLDTTESYAYGATREGTYFETGDETVFRTLVDIADRSGEHFREVGETVEWMQIDTETGPQIVSGQRTSGDTLTAARYERDENAYEQVTRIYAVGRGIGDNRATLTEADSDDLPSYVSFSSGAGTDASPYIFTFNGNTYNWSNESGYIANDTLETSIGYNIEVRRQYPTIGSAEANGDSREASRALLQQVINDLDRAASPVVNVTATVIEPNVVMRPGMSCLCDYKQLSGIRTTETLTVTKTQFTTDRTGHRYDLSLSNINRSPMTNAGMVVKALQTKSKFIEHRQTVTGAAVNGQAVQEA